jgi:hypothetical protein
MGGIISGGGGKGSSSGYDVTSGGGPFEFGPSAFDLQMIQDAVGQNVQSIQNRYQQLGLGGSTMEGQDVAGAQQMGQAEIGQQQTQDVSDPAFNPALQQISNQLIGTGQQGQQLSTLADLAKIGTSQQTQGGEAAGLTSGG